MLKPLHEYPYKWTEVVTQKNSVIYKYPNDTTPLGYKLPGDITLHAFSEVDHIELIERVVKLIDDNDVWVKLPMEHKALTLALLELGFEFIGTLITQFGEVVWILFHDTRRLDRPRADFQIGEAYVFKKLKEGLAGPVHAIEKKLKAAHWKPPMMSTDDDIMNEEIEALLDGLVEAPDQVHNLFLTDMSARQDLFDNKYGVREGTIAQVYFPIISDGTIFSALNDFGELTKLCMKEG
jgi:hypothetical protein